MHANAKGRNDVSISKKKAVAGSKREGELRSSTHRAHAGRSEQGTYVRRLEVRTRRIRSSISLPSPLRA
jgi:hypothetical protein